ncbi:MAG: sodium:alanine symporter family protein [Gammaproteobacteria bacterium]|nr:sodium:alanine symporter family protein [Gammaproteobacteria bacterium]
MDSILGILIALNRIIWHDSVLIILLGTGVIFTIWSGFCQYRALTHGVLVLRGTYDDPNHPGAINHFQALSAALSATVGLGNIGGVALAIALGGPGAIFWMWIVGLFGMAIKLTEVSLSMLYRNTEDPDNPHGGPMWVVSKGLSKLNPKLAPLGKLIGGFFCFTLLISTATGGNMFQAWNVGEITEEYFGIPSILTGITLAILVGMVIIGGIKRIGAVAGRLVPFMVSLYLIAGLFVLISNAGEIPSMLALIVRSAFIPQEMTGAFIGGTAGYAFLFGMKRALFSNEAGQGTSPIAHSAAKTDEPVREAMVAGLEPFIDTIVVCTFTALVILSTGVWNRAPEAQLDTLPTFSLIDSDSWVLETVTAPQRINDDWSEGDIVFIIVNADANPQSGNNSHRLEGRVVEMIDEDSLSSGLFILWDQLSSESRPTINETGIYATYVGATLTAKAFDSVIPGLGKWLITLAVWLFAISTMISWSYYGEQGVVFLFGDRMVLTYKFVYCALIIIATWGFIESDADLDNLTGVGTGVMLWANVPIMWLFVNQAMRSYHDYIHRLKTGQLKQSSM